MDRKRKTRLIVGLILLALLTAAVVAANSSLFELTEVSVEGNAAVSDGEIKEMLGLSEGTNLIRYFLKHFGRELPLDQRFKKLDVYFDWPHAARIEVEEESLIGCLYYQGAYLCLNRLGMVMDSFSELPEGLALIRGVTVGSFVVGEVPVTDDPEPFELVLSIGRILEKYGLSRSVKEINVRQPDSIVLYAEKLDVCCGSRDHLDEKLYVLKCLWDEQPEISGVLHIENLDKQIYLESKN